MNEKYVIFVFTPNFGKRKHLQSKIEKVLQGGFRSHF